MQQVQARKQRMIAGALTDQEVRTARIEELKMLFRWICMMKFIFDERRNSEGFFLYVSSEDAQFCKFWRWSMVIGAPSFTMIAM